MAKDVKIEVLYYKTSNDISLEFGLHGNYPLRLLSSACKDIDSFFLALKRAVSRSEIIITVGGYSDRDYLPRFIAQAIGRKTETPDYSKLGIITETKYPIPQNSDPLYPKSHQFGGFLIESGPQTIISLTDDRKVRLAIANEFIVDYITEHHNVFDKPFGVKMGNAVIREQSDQQETLVMTDFSDISSSSHTKPEFGPDTTVAELTDKKGDAPIVGELKDSQSEETIDEQTVETTEQPYKQSDEGIEPHSATIACEIPIDDNSTSQLSETDNETNSDIQINVMTLPDFEPIDVLPTPDNDDNYFYEKHYTRRKKRIVRLACLILSLLIILATVVGDFLLSRHTSTEPKDYYESLNSIYYSYGDDISAGYNAVKKQNNSCFTWLRFDKINIDHPVFTVNNTENGAYLNQLPNGISDARGMLFSSTSESAATSNNITIFGNADLYGLFNNLASSVQTDPNYLLGAELTASDNRFSASWQVFSVFTHSSVDNYDYLDTTFEDDEQYSSHLLKLQQLSFQKYEHEFFGKESLLILIGISDTERFVAVAYLKSIRVLSFAGDHTDSSSTDITSSATDGSTVITPSEPTVGEAEGDDDFHGDSPDIILPPPPVSSDTSSTTSSNTSSVTSSTESSTTSSSVSSTTSSAVSSVTSSQISSVVSSQNSSTQSSSVSSNVSSDVSSSASSESTSTETSSTTSGSVSSNVTPSQPSSSEQASSVTSSESVSSEASSATSSSTTSSEEDKPQVDPIYTWDVELSCIDNSTGIKYTGSAVNIVAMIIEDEMSPTIDPPEALISQAIVKYNWLINNGALNSSKPPSNALDPNPTPQAIQYATAAKGSVLMYGNTLARTYCYAYSAGKTACYQDIWGGTAYPYLQSVDCSVDETLKDFKTSTTYSADKIKEIIKVVCGIDVSQMEKSEWLKPVKYDANELYCLKISIGGKEYNGRYLRETLLAKKNTGVAAIRSTAYEILYNEEDDTFTVTCKGYGHGVGFSQRGAKAYALQGWTHEQLLAHFFPGTTLIKN